MNRQLTEAEFDRMLRELYEALGWIGYHTYDSRRSERGFPDRVLVHPIQRRIIFAELKTDTGRIRPAQKAWLWALEQTGLVEVYVWRPKMWTQIVRMLERKLV